MSQARQIMIDGNEAAASVAYRTNEVIAIYPITPSSPMGELSDAWSANGQPNIWGDIPEVIEMQSEGGAAGAVHGALQAGSLTTTFTASQGLLLMIPNMYKIAGELTPFCMHVAARTLATHALSIFGDHSDVMAVRQCGFGLLSSNSVQEAHDFALIGQIASLESRVPFLHFFDGFRTSHEISKIWELSNEDLLALIPEAPILDHRDRALTPDRPVIRGTAQNPDTFFQAREACNSFYMACPEIVARTMDQFAARTGRRYQLFDYVGHPEAERIIVLMGSGAETAHETVDYLCAQGEKVGIIKVRLFNPFSMEHFLEALPPTVEKIAVLDRTKEPGTVGEPLYLNLLAGLSEAEAANLIPSRPTIVGGRYGLSSKEFPPRAVKAVFDELDKESPKNHFTVGIVDDITHTSIPVNPEFRLWTDDRVEAVFYGLGADGTVGANKNSIKIIGGQTEQWAQGYFVYDSKKSGAMTVSHLRFGKDAIRSTYLIDEAQFIACHQWQFISKLDLLHCAGQGATFLVNSPYGPEEVWDHLPLEIQEDLIAKEMDLWVIDAYKVASAAGTGSRINTIMQTCFFNLSGVLPPEEAILHIKEAIEKTYGKKGGEIVKRNYRAVDGALAELHQVTVPKNTSTTRRRLAMVSPEAPDEIKKINAVMMANMGDHLPVSSFPVDGTWSTGTTQWEKRNIAQEIPLWENDICIQCNHCAFVCPHAAIRAKVFDGDQLEKAPEDFLSMDYKAKDFAGLKYTLQVAPEDCTGCNLCVMVCPAKDKANPRRKAINMKPILPVVEQEKERFDFFLTIPELDRESVARIDAKGSQFFQPLFEYSGACAGCGETPYVKLMTQLFGDRTVIANATGCSSIYGGNLPTTPYTTDPEGRGPAWSNSLFEDNAEFGLGFRLAIDRLEAQAQRLLKGLSSTVGDTLVTALLEADQHGEAALKEQRARVAQLRQLIADTDSPNAHRLRQIADYLVRKNVWIVGGDGWAYDIGYGGLDHVIASGRDVNILVLDTEVYSNTGGQASKATPLGAAAKFAVAGKEVTKKDLGLLAMSYGHVYVANLAFGSKINHTVKAFLEAESYPGPSLLLAYSHCIAHGYDMAYGVEQQKLAVNSGVWPLYRFDPRRIEEGKPPLQLDSKRITAKVGEYMHREARFRMVEKRDPARYRSLAKAAQEGAERRMDVYRQLAGLTYGEDTSVS